MEEANAVEAVPHVVESIEKLLKNQQRELLQHLDSLADRLIGTANTSPPATLAIKSTLGPLEASDVQTGLEGEGQKDTKIQKLKSYEEARLTHVQVTEATPESVLVRAFSERKPFQYSWEQFRKICQSAVESTWANAFFAGLILTNSLFLGVQLEMQASFQDVSIEKEFFTILNVSYAALFTIEAFLRLVAAGPVSYVWLSDDYAWNWLDVFVVFASWVELIISMLTPGSSTTGANRNLRMLRLLRFGRIVRVVRVVRVARLFRSLRTLINSLMGTLKSLFWSLLLLALIMYMCLAVFIQLVNFPASSGEKTVRRCLRVKSDMLAVSFSCRNVCYFHEFPFHHFEVWHFVRRCGAGPQE